MNDSDRQPQCPYCKRRKCVVRTAMGWLCNLCRKNFQVK